MKPSDFVHLHVHSEFSLLDGAGRISDLVGKAARLKMPALALTDHGNLHGAIKFYQAAMEAGIKPIIGCEIYVAPGSRRDRATGIRETPSHLTLLAADNAGYHNLIVLATLAHLEGFYYKPRIDRELLEKHRPGLIALSGCLKGEVTRALNENREADAEKSAVFYRDLFGKGNYYLELHDHGIREQKLVNPRLIALGRRLGIPLVAANDCHYVEKDDAASQDILLCLQTGHKLEDEKRLKMSTPEFYLKSQDEMEALFPECPAALAATREIADRCLVELDFGGVHLPAFVPPDGKTPTHYLRELCEAGIPQRFGQKTEAIQKQLDHELKVIEGKSFETYFLIIWDIIHYAKSHNIPVGPGRGSAAGSLVAYLLGITDIDPFPQNLLFERFLNPSRATLPDIDMDFCDRRRGEVIQYVAEKYGRDRVAQIITFGTLGARAVLRDVGRVKGFSYPEMDAIAKLVPIGPRMTLKKALEIEPRLKEMTERDPRIKELMEVSFKLEGISRNASTHAAGIVISDRPLIEMVPLCRGSNDEKVTQFDMTDVEQIGLLKMDFLGLKTLSVIKDTMEMVEKSRSTAIRLDRLPLDDAKTFQLLAKANTVGVFQLESSGMRDLSHRIGLKKFDDLLDLVALFRPGPMHMLEDYIERKHGKVKIKYDHPRLEPILKNTYGIMLYQEQVMMIANQLAGFSLAEADILRHAMAKKKVDEMDRVKEAFIRGAVKNAISKGVADKIFQAMARFAEYGFNKSHSAAYALIAYRTAYLKAHHPREYMSALLTGEMGKLEKMTVYVTECRAMGIKVLPPDVNESLSVFTVVKEGIRFGLAAIKNVGEGAVASILAAREGGGAFKNLFDFLDRVDLSAANKKVLESLIRSGALDSFPGQRAQKMAVLERAIEVAQQKRRDREKGQGSLFDQFEASSGPEFPPVAEYPQPELLAMEKELLGMYITGHPLSHYEKTLVLYASHTVRGLSELKDHSPVRLGGIIASVEEKTAKKTGKKFAVCRLEDLTGTAEIVLYAKEYETFAKRVTEGAVVFVEGSVNSREMGSNVVVSAVYPLAGAFEKLTQSIHISLHLSSVDEGTLQRIQTVLNRHPGASPVVFDLDFATGETVVLKSGSRFRVACTPRLIEELEKILGENTVRVVS
ncbi:MAG: DNA polymerase III subunit alpha [Candidatus Aureabacteria bacterium]|nr:DNA polymerase III subunit alpha [Candidatus Auribacterota bacterium]